MWSSGNPPNAGDDAVLNGCRLTVAAVSPDGIGLKSLTLSNSAVLAFDVSGKISTLSLIAPTGSNAIRFNVPGLSFQTNTASISAPLSINGTGTVIVTGNWFSAAGVLCPSTARLQLSTSMVSVFSGSSSVTCTLTSGAPTAPFILSVARGSTFIGPNITFESAATINGTFATRINSEYSISAVRDTTFASGASIFGSRADVTFVNSTVSSTAFNLTVATASGSVSVSGVVNVYGPTTTKSLAVSGTGTINYYSNTKISAGTTFTIWNVAFHGGGIVITDPVTFPNAVLFDQATVATGNHTTLLTFNGQVTTIGPVSDIASSVGGDLLLGSSATLSVSNFFPFSATGRGIRAMPGGTILMLEAYGTQLLVADTLGPNLKVVGTGSIHLTSDGSSIVGPNNLGSAYILAPYSGTANITGQASIAIYAFQSSASTLIVSGSDLVINYIACATDGVVVSLGVDLTFNTGTIRGNFICVSGLRNRCTFNTSSTQFSGDLVVAGSAPLTLTGSSKLILDTYQLTIPTGHILARDLISGKPGGLVTIAGTLKSSIVSGVHGGPTVTFVDGASVVGSVNLTGPFTAFSTFCCLLCICHFYYLLSHIGCVGLLFAIFVAATGALDISGTAPEIDSLTYQTDLYFKAGTNAKLISPRAGSASSRLFITDNSAVRMAGSPMLKGSILYIGSGGDVLASGGGTIVVDTGLSVTSLVGVAGDSSFAAAITHSGGALTFTGTPTDQLIVSSIISTFGGSSTVTFGASSTVSVAGLTGSSIVNFDGCRVTTDAVLSGHTSNNRGPTSTRTTTYDTGSGLRVVPGLSWSAGTVTPSGTGTLQLTAPTIGSGAILSSAGPALSITPVSSIQGRIATSSGASLSITGPATFSGTITQTGTVATTYTFSSMTIATGSNFDLQGNADTTLILNSVVMAPDVAIPHEWNLVVGGGGGSGVSTITTEGTLASLVVMPGGVASFRGNSLAVGGPVVCYSPATIASAAAPSLLVLTPGNGFNTSLSDVGGVVLSSYVKNAPIAVLLRVVLRCVDAYFLFAVTM